MLAADPTYHILPDLTNFVYVLGGVVIAFLGAWPLFKSKMKSLEEALNKKVADVKTDVAAVKTDVADVKTTAEVASSKASANEKQTSENRTVLANQIGILSANMQAVNSNVTAVAYAQTPIPKLIAPDFQNFHNAGPSNAGKVTE